MKKVLVCALAALFLMASCVTAFATSFGGAEYVTTTAYTTDNKLEVTTTVTGAEDGTMLTYLAYKADGEEGPTNTNIKYVDQQTAAGTVTFSYKTDKNNLTGTTVMFGSEAEDEAVVEDEDLRKRIVTITDGEESEEILLPTEVVANDYPTSIVVAEGYELTAATYGEENVAAYVTVAEDGTVYFKDNAMFVDGAEIVVTITEIPSNPVAAEVRSVYGNAGRIKEVGSENYIEKLTLFGKATTNKAEGFGGMIITTNAAVAADEEAFVLGGTDVQTFAALYKGEDGSFAVQLRNETEEKDLTDGSYYGRVYVISDNDGEDIVYSNVKYFAATVEE